MNIYRLIYYSGGYQDYKSLSAALKAMSKHPNSKIVIHSK